MADRNPLKTDFLSISHLPTWMLVIGYPMYWLELYVLKAGRGITSGWAWVILAAVSLVLIYQDRKAAGNICRGYKEWFSGLSAMDRVLVCVGLSCAVLIFGIAVYAWTFPIHLIQESDSLIYRVMLPRQHLVRGTFDFIPWSTFDLYLLPLDYAVAPFVLSTALPNKFPQMIFFIGLLFVLTNLVQRRPWPSLLIFLLVLGSHGIGIQMGTAMMDLALCYLVLAAWDSLRHGKIALFLVEFCFYFWARSFAPVQTIIIFAGLGIIYQFVKLSGKVRMEIFSGDEPEFSLSRYKKYFLRIVLGFTALSVLVAGPFIVKSLWHAGTPLYPIAPGIMMINSDIDRASRVWGSIDETARGITDYVRTYGEGKDIAAFIKHFWLIAVPEQGVNNRFDYPAGLPFLLVVLPFFWLLGKKTAERTFAGAAWFAVLYWGLWWLTSQQMRFLYLTLFLMFTLFALNTKIFSRTLFFCILIALALNMASMVRAHKMDWGRSYEEVLRPQDRELVRLSREYFESGKTGSVVLDYGLGDVAYAQFPVVIPREGFPNVLFTDNREGKE